VELVAGETGEMRGVPVSVAGGAFEMHPAANAESATT